MTELTGEEIRRLRKRAGIDVNELAPRLKYTPEHFSRIEKGRRGKKKVSVPEGIAKPLQRAMLNILDERKDYIQQAESLNAEDL